MRAGVAAGIAFQMAGEGRSMAAQIVSGPREDAAVSAIRDRAHSLRDPSDVSAIVGFGTYRGSVVAASDWGAQHRSMRVPPANGGSYEALFHRADVGDAVVPLPEDGPLTVERGHRAIGVTYDPEREVGNYVPTELGRRYDLFVFLDETTALHPILETEPADAEPETYPWGV
jgi:hypothetical protein